MQRALIQYRDPKLYDLVEEALVKAGRTDLIGYGPKCLIRPRKGRTQRTQRTERTQEKALKKKKKAIRNIHKKK